MQQYRRFSVGLVIAAGALVVLSCRLDPAGQGRSGESGRGVTRPVGKGGNVPIRFHAIPAHVVPPCASCHVEPGVNGFQASPAQCGACHEDGVPQPEHASNALEGVEANRVRPAQGTLP